LCAARRQAGGLFKPRANVWRLRRRNPEGRA
jgi:hypothetical protein